MKIRVAKTAGFCMGVRRAVNLVLEESRRGELDTLGPLIHNDQVVQWLARRGIRAASDPEALPPGRLVLPSHGIGPEARRRLQERGFELCDATCPRVGRVHGVVKQHHGRGFFIVVVGDPGHAEVEGILGFTEGRAAVISTPEEAAGLPEVERVCVVAQTTQSPERFAEAVAAIERRYSELDPERLVVVDTICDSTYHRQREVKALAREVDAVIVVGGRNSANTLRLAEVAEAAGRPSFRVETEADLDWDALQDFKRVGITAGASTPQWLIRRVYEELARRDRERKPWSLRWLYQLPRFLVLSNLLVALGAAGLMAAASRLQGLRLSPLGLLLCFCYVFAVHTINVLINREAVALNEPARARAFEQHRELWIFFCLFSLLLAWALALAWGWMPFLLFTGAVAPSIFYQVRILRRSRFPGLIFQALSDLPGSKDIFMAIGWTLVTVILPLAAQGWRGASPASLVAALLVFGWVLWRSALQDFRHLQGDRLVGRETLPIALGERSARRLLYALALALLLLLALSARFHLVPSLGYGLMAAVAYLAAWIPVFSRRTELLGLRAEFLVDFTFILAGFITWAWAW
jgi:(E)-4-hydroxy-3-methyl-but-2-enyl pyrophosphate reductase